MLLATIFILYVIGDYLTTIIAIESSPLGIKGELNPLAVLLYTHYGSMGLLVVKLVMFTLLSLTTLLTLKKSKKSGPIVKKALVGFSIVCTAVVCINMYTLLTL